MEIGLKVFMRATYWVVYWSVLNSRSFILVKWLVKINKMKLGWIGLNWAKMELSTDSVKFQNSFEVFLLS